jgi:hypothetical protein
MKQLKIFGEELNIAFNLATQIAFEGITGENFTLEAVQKTSNTAALYYATIIANNPQTAITLDDVLLKFKAADIAAISKAVFDAISEWCEGAEQPKDETETPDDKKNV